MNITKTIKKEKKKGNVKAVGQLPISKGK